MNRSTKMGHRSAAARHVLPAMRRLGKQGVYREAIRTFLRLPVDTEAQLRRGGIAVELQLQYAIALQHAGLFGAAKDSYEKVVAALRSKTSSVLAADAIYNASVQMAVLRERLGDPRGALELLDRLGAAGKHRDMRLARASLQSWISITRMKSLLTLNRKRALHTLASKLLNLGDWNEKIWSTIFISLLDLRGGPPRAQRAAADRMRAAVEEMFEKDVSGAPWTALLAGKHPTQSSLAREFLEKAHAGATRLGKFFVIAEAAELLASNRLVEQKTREWYLRRAISAYARCNLLMQSPFRQRMFHAAAKVWGVPTAQQTILQSAHLLESRETLVFSVMCKHLKGTSGFGKTSADVFEEFVRDWAMNRFPGTYKHIERGQWTADAIIVQKDGGVVLQAKHVSTPRQHIPRHLYFRKLYEVYGVHVKRYVFVVSSSNARGWSENDWHTASTEALRNIVPDHIAVDIVLEPELQTDVLLDDDLYDKYFGSYRRRGR